MLVLRLTEVITSWSSRKWKKKKG